MWILPPPVLIVKLPLQSPLWHLLSAQVGSQHVIVGFQSDPQTFLWTWAGDGPRVSSWSWRWRWRYRGVSCRPPSQSWSPLLVPQPFLSAHTTGVRLRMWCRKRCSSQSTFSFVSWSFSLFFSDDFFLLLCNEGRVQCLLLCAAVPLYQEYCLQEMKGYLQRISKSPVSELLSPQYVQELQSRICSSCHSEAALPPPEPTAAPSVCLSIPRSIPTVTPGTLWQELEEVKASGITSNMTAKEILLQEVSFWSLVASRNCLWLEVRRASDLKMLWRWKKIEN